MSEDKSKDKSKIEEPKIKVTTLKELGPNLPIGVKNAGGNYSKNISILPWKVKDEKELGRMRDEEDASVSNYIGIILSYMLSEFGGKKLKREEITASRLFFSQCYVPDVFYAYIWLRRNVLGKDLKMSNTCRHCKKETELVVDIDTLEVKTVEKFEDSLWEYELLDELELRGKKIKKFILGPPKWFHIDEIYSVNRINVGAIKDETLRGSIVDIPELTGGTGEIVLSPEELEELTKRDLETLISEIDEHSIGPNMLIEWQCESCRREHESSIEWVYDHFFGGSSL